jgi:hypothetical protein
MCCGKGYWPITRRLHPYCHIDQLYHPGPVQGCNEAIPTQSICKGVSPICAQTVICQMQVHKGLVLVECIRQSLGSVWPNSCFGQVQLLKGSMVASEGIYESLSRFCLGQYMPCSFCQGRVVWWSYARGNLTVRVSLPSVSYPIMCQV